MNKKKYLLLFDFVFSVFLLFAETVNSISTSNTSFTSTDNIKKAQVATATNEYIVTAGDIYTLVYAGGSFSVSVDSTYRVRIANLGIITAKGLTLQEFKNKVETLIINNYPTMGVQFFLANPAQFHVFIKGEVSSAQTIETWALERASSLLKEYYTNYSSTRLFTIVSEDKKIKTYDLFEASRNGDFSQDPYLRPGDTIIVPKIDRKVEITGEVFRPGTYEILPGEELSELIFDYADGFTPFAQKDNIEVSHYIEKTGVYKTSYYNETDLLSTIPLTSYDRIYIPSVKDTKSVIYVEGAVNNKYNSVTKTVILDKDEVLPSGEVVSSPTSMNKLKFEYSEGKSFVSFILENSAMFINSSDLENAYIIRQNDESDETIPVNIGNILYPSKKDKGFTDFEINANDRIIIPYTQYYVTVTGGVNSVGKYAYQPGKTWEYYINLADGFNLDENLFSSVKITDKNGKKLSKKSEIPPEAVIYASRNSPKNGWLIPLITSILTFITTCLTFIGTIMNFS